MNSAARGARHGDRGGGGGGGAWLGHAGRRGPPEQRRLGGSSTRCGAMVRCRPPTTPKRLAHTNTNATGTTHANARTFRLRLGTPLCQQGQTKLLLQTRRPAAQRSKAVQVRSHNTWRGGGKYTRHQRARCTAYMHTHTHTHTHTRARARRAVGGIRTTLARHRDLFPTLANAEDSSTGFVLAGQTRVDTHNSVYQQEGFRDRCSG